MLALTIIGLQIAGCTAYREISRGAIDANSYWSLEHGWGRNYRRETTGIRSKNELLLFTPCNFGRKYVFMVAPIPLPLGTVSGVENMQRFTTDLRIYANQSDIRIDLARIRLTLADGNEYYPSGISPTCSQCENNNHTLSSDLETFEKVYVAKGGGMGVTLQYPIVAPGVDEVFNLRIEDFVSNDKQISVPKITFKKASSWGGW